MRKVVAQISLALFFFFAPINFYIIGNSRGFGIQTIFFRFQITDIGPSFITFIRDFQLILEDYIHGITAMSYIAWTTGVFFIIFCLISILMQVPEKMSRAMMKISGICLLIAIIAFISSLVLQYGPLLHSDAGLTIPFGIPLLIFIDYMIFRQVKQNNHKSDANNIFTETEH